MALDLANVIQGLLASAEDESYPDNVRASYRAKAEELMVKYRIDQEEAIAQGAGDTPIRSKIIIADDASEMRRWYYSVFASVAQHCGIRYLVNTERLADQGGRWFLVAHVVGYEGDIRYAEFLWTAAHLMFVTRIDPSWDATLSEAENVWRLRNAGIERRVIADRAWGNGREASARSKVQRIYLRECARRGEAARAAGLSHQTATYRRAYAASFQDTLRQRLQNARDAADSVRGGLVLHGRSERVDEEFYGHFPAMRPTPRTDVPTEPAAPCPKCEKAKSGHCRDHRPLVWTKADEARWQRMNNSPSAHAGAASGRDAAEGVIIQRGHERAARVERGGSAIEG